MTEYEQHDDIGMDRNRKATPANTMNQEASNGESAPAVVKASHPWKTMWANKAKLKAARKEAKRRYERTSEVRNDEYYRLKRGESVRKSGQRAYRKKIGVPLDAPKAKPWDFAKGKCPNGKP